ncbi:ATP-grasp domain-containing protein [Streptomyces sp. NPDC096136]|uniref:D-alanine--D-alanine ligase family protein n=1 Tax=Streptomyces sp. NPDC096136 TaxID=3366076 RepID=UPI003804085C
MHITSWLDHEPHRLRELVRSAVARTAPWRVAVLYGGTSAEDRLYMESKPASDWSVHDVLDGLRQLGTEADWIDPTSPAFPSEITAYDAAFLNVHGDFGEDGHLQGTLAYLGVPYTGSSVATGVIGADKRLTKLLLASSGVTVPAHRRLSPAGTPEAGLPCPVMLKAVNGGSSVGMVLVTEPDDVAPALRGLGEAGFTDVIAEPFVDGTTVTVSALRIDGEVVLLPPVTCGTEREYYDEYSKLHGERAGTVTYLALTDADDPRLHALHRATRHVLEVIDFEGAIRVDFILTPEGDPVLLELNTIPGVQHGSNLVLAAAAAGITYPELLGVVLASAANTAKLAPWRRERADLA